MDKPTVRVLLIEDDRDDYFLTRDLLADIPGHRYHLDWAATYDAGLEALRRGEHDVCLLDYRLGARNGLDLLRDATVAGCKAAIILLTGQQDRFLDFAAMEAGAVDFLEKGRLDAALLERAIRYGLQQKRYADELEQRVAERTAELARANAALKEADRRKDEFLATLAHELRGPLAPVRNMVEIMKRAGGDAELIAEASSTMERQLAQLVRLVDDLLDVSRITRNKMELRKERVELAAVVSMAVEACRPMAEAGSLELAVMLPDAPVYLDADPVRLAQVFGNLLSNACKYTLPGGKVWLTAERRGNDAVVTVKDTGVGIPADKLTTIFEMFAQVDTSLERSQGGLGIGLTLVRRLVEMHGGTVAASSEGPGRGSELVVRLPILIDQPNGQHQPATGGQCSKVPGRRILIVDDNRDSARSLAMLLKLSGHETQTAHDGQEAVEAAGRFRPDVVLLDIGLPKRNGYDACRHIREQPWGRDMVLVALTGWGQEEDRRRSQEAGFNHHLVKPVDFDELSRLLAAVPRGPVAPTRP